MSLPTDPVIEGFRGEAQRIREQLEGCDAVVSDVVRLSERLIAMRPLLLAHLEAKDAFYRRLQELCRHRPGEQTAVTFAEQMRAQADAVRRFFLALEPSASVLLTQSYRTMALIIRNRLTTEERSVYPLYLENA